MPAPIALAATASSGPAAPFVLAGLGAAALGRVALGQIGKGRKTANKWTPNEKRFLDEVLAPAVRLKATDPVAAAAMVDRGWRAYLANADAFSSKGSTEAKVITQNLTNPDFMNTVTDLLGRDPLHGDYVGSFLAEKSPGGGSGIFGRIAGGIIGGLGKILPQVISTRQTTPPYNPNAGTGTAPQTPPAGGGGFPVPDGTTDPNNPFKGMLVPTLISTGASLLSGWLGARAAGKAGDAQADAATRAAELQAASSADALAYLKETQAPWIKSGGEALKTIGDITSNWPTPPTPESIMTDPAVKFRLEQGRKAIESSAAARGTSFSGATLKDIDTYAQGVASDEYSKVFDRFQVERAARLNPLLSVAGVGQVAANQTTANAANIGMTGAQRVGEFGTEAAANRASGYVGGANAWRESLQGLSSNVIDLAEIYRRSRVA